MGVFTDAHLATLRGGREGRVRSSEGETGGKRDCCGVAVAQLITNGSENDVVFLKDW